MPRTQGNKRRRGGGAPNEGISHELDTEIHNTSNGRSKVRSEDLAPRTPSRGIERADQQDPTSDQLYPLPKKPKLMPQNLLPGVLSGMPMGDLSVDLNRIQREPFMAGSPSVSTQPSPRGWIGSFFRSFTPFSSSNTKGIATPTPLAHVTGTHTDEESALDGNVQHHDKDQEDSFVMIPQNRERVKILDYNNAASTMNSSRPIHRTRSYTKRHARIRSEATPILRPGKERLEESGHTSDLQAVEQGVERQKIGHEVTHGSANGTNARETKQKQNVGDDGSQHEDDTQSKLGESDYEFVETPRPKSIYQYREAVAMIRDPNGTLEPIPVKLHCDNSADSNFISRHFACMLVTQYRKFKILPLRREHIVTYAALEGECRPTRYLTLQLRCRGADEWKNVSFRLVDNHEIEILIGDQTIESHGIRVQEQNSKAKAWPSFYKKPDDQQKAKEKEREERNRRKAFELNRDMQRQIAENSNSGTAYQHQSSGGDQGQQSQRHGPGDTNNTNTSATGG